jgi:hypothetical protein
MLKTEAWKFYWLVLKDPGHKHVQLAGNLYPLQTKEGILASDNPTVKEYLMEANQNQNFF